jgi:hypothetical protein
MVPGLRAELERAVAAYGGLFLEGLSLQDAPEFEDWMAGQRAHWLSVMGELLDRLATLQADEGDLGAAAGTLERWVALDPGEEAWQRLIAAHLERGDGAAARRAWAACWAALADLDTTPSAATETVAARIATFAPARRGSPIGPGRSDPVGLDVSVVPLLGRGRELARLCQAYARAQTAGTQVVVLEGETNSGKTRLATEFLDWARGQRAEVLVGRSFEAEGGLPYAPLIAALRPRLERENAPDDLLGDLWLAELAHLLPELRERYPDLPPVSADETVGRGRLFEAVARLAQALVERAPLVLFLDDVQWADATTRDLLRYVVRWWAESGARALVLVAVRAEDVGAGRELAQWLGHLERDAPTVRLGLKALTPDDVAQLVVSLVGLEGVDQADGQADEAARLGHWLAQETAGQPGALVRPLRALQEEGALALRSLEDGGWVLDLARTSQALEAAAGRAAAGAPAGIGGRQDWGKAPDTSAFYGRDGDLQRLGRWLLVDRCRLVGLGHRGHRQDRPGGQTGARGGPTVRGCLLAQPAQRAARRGMARRRPAHPLGRTGRPAERSRGAARPAAGAAARATLPARPGQPGDGVAAGRAGGALPGGLRGVWRAAATAG